MNRISNTTQFNGQNVLDGSASSLAFQVGANQNQTISVTGVDARAAILGARVSESGSIDQTAINASIAADILVISGISIDLSGLSAGDSVDDIAAAINQVTSQTGVSAQQATTVTTDVRAAVAGTATINGVTVTTLLAAGNQAANISAINAVSAQTGVTAVASGANDLVLTNTDGTDINIGGTGLGAAETFQAGIVLSGAVSESNTDFTVAGTFAAETNALGSNQTNNTLTATDVLSRENATTALLTLDTALSQVSTLRSELGAVQTRFESTISNLQITSENLSAARSRIQDADFAAETAAFTRSQILQQAGLSVVAQANALPQSVLSLLP